uniref:Recombinase family protein n=1 Tax=Phenylobacterium glaciei TaxID=2803784 RepID=A0A974P110_9CAUL|nr:recombinase family protein [Phenylobacterium glaciei]
MLRNDTYMGVLTFGRRSGPLGQRVGRTSPETWVQAEAHFEPLVASRLFADAQRLLDRYRRLSDEEALERLAAPPRRICV